MKRILMFVLCTTALVGQLESGGDYRDLRPSIGICLLDATEFRSEAALHHSFQLRTAGNVPSTRPIGNVHPMTADN